MRLNEEKNKYKARDDYLSKKEHKKQKKCYR